MSKLFRTLPAFAPDYSGFLSLLHGLGGLMIVHDPSGCLGNYTNCDEPRWFHDPQPVFSSVIRELEMVVGDDSGIIKKAESEILRRKPEFTCILGTPVPALTGCDVGLIAEKLAERTGSPCFGIPTDGFGFYGAGIEKALAFLEENFLQKGLDKIPKSVNVLGMTPLDYSIYGEKEKLIQIIEKAGWKINTFLGMENNWNTVRQAYRAEKNIVMCSAALPLAEKMKKTGDIPYWMGPPCGRVGIRSLHIFLNGGHGVGLGGIPTGNVYEKRVLIIAEQAAANAFRRFLQAEQSCLDVKIATFFTYKEEIAESGDIKLEDERGLRKLLEKDHFDIVIGDPLFSSLCKEGQSFISWPHSAVSSKLYWKTAVSCIGEMPLQINYEGGTK